MVKKALRTGATIALCSSVLLLSGCVTPSTGERAAPAGGETAAMAATFRYLFDNNASALQSGAATYCVGIGSGSDLKDPGAALLAALKDVRPAVSPASRCRRDVRATDAAGRPALIFNLRTITCDGADDCLFEGGYFEGNLSGSGGRYRARRSADGWQVQPQGPVAVS